MKYDSGIFFKIALICGILLNSCGEKPDKTTEQTQIQQHRHEKDHYFSTNKNSPFTEKQQSQFSGLSYYPVDLEYRVQAKLQRYDAKDTIAIQTTTNRKQYYYLWGEFQFQIHDRPETLVVYKPLEISDNHTPYFFVPFYDPTNGESTYGGGRYLDIPIRNSDIYTLDFNLAYNPYCAYDHSRWSCPIPPLENRLDIPVKAGEKVYPHAK